MTATVNACLTQKHEKQTTNNKQQNRWDLKNRRTFLKRTLVEGVKLSDLYVGNQIIVYARQLNIVDYADDWTRKTMESATQKVALVIKPDAYENMGEVVSAIEADEGLTIAQCTMYKWSMEQASTFVELSEITQDVAAHVEHLSSSAVLAMEVIGQGAVNRVQTLVGPAHPGEAKVSAPSSLRARFGSNPVNNAVHVSPSAPVAERQISWLFGASAASLASFAAAPRSSARAPPVGGKGKPNFQMPARFSDCTLAVVKPHAVAEGSLGKILTAILEEGYEITAVYMTRLTTPNAEEFLEVYQTVVPEFKQMVEQLASGPCVAIEVCSESPVQSFRAFCGPPDPEVARTIRPNTLRAKFGKSTILNGVHCTDMPEDGALEVEYFFKILPQAA